MLLFYSSLFRVCDIGGDFDEKMMIVFSLSLVLVIGMKDSHNTYSSSSLINNNNNNNEIITTTTGFPEKRRRHRGRV